jgi:hypothetical protein
MASLYFEGGGWTIHYPFPNGPQEATSVVPPKALPLSEETINQVLDAIADHAEPSF